MIQLSDKVGQLLLFDQRRPGQILFLFTQGQLGFFLPFRLLGDRLLKKGMSGSDVRELQQNLLKLGYALPKYGADGAEIRSSSRYMALGNSIYWDKAIMLMMDTKMA